MSTLKEHSVEITEIYSHFFGKNFVKVMVLLTKLLNSWFDKIFFNKSKFFIFPKSAFLTLYFLISTYVVFLQIGELSYLSTKPLDDHGKYF